MPSISMRNTYAVATFAAPKTMKDLLLRAHDKTRRLLLMERTQSLEIRARTAEIDVSRDQIRDVYPFTDGINGFLRNLQLWWFLWV